MDEGGSLYEVVVLDDGPRRLRLQVRGEIDMAVAPQMLDSILCAGLAGHCAAVVVDLGEVDFIDSSGLGALLEAHRRLAGVDCRLSVTGLSPRLRRVMDTAGLTRALGLDLMADSPPRVVDSAEAS